MKGGINKREIFLSQTSLAELRNASLHFPCPCYSTYFCSEGIFLPSAAYKGINWSYAFHLHHPATEQLLLIFMSLTPASSPLSQPLPSSIEVLLASPQIALISAWEYYVLWVYCTGFCYLQDIPWLLSHPGVMAVQEEPRPSRCSGL